MFLLAIPSRRESKLLSQRLVTCHKPSKTRARYFGLELVRNSQIKIQFTDNSVKYSEVILDHMFYKSFRFSISSDDAIQFNDKGENSTKPKYKNDSSSPKDNKAKVHFETEELSLGFPDKDEAIQLGLIVPDESRDDKNAEELGKGQNLIELENQKSSTKNKTNLNNSELSVVSLKNYSQILDLSTENTTKDDENGKSSEKACLNLETASLETQPLDEIKYGTNENAISVTNSKEEACTPSIPFTNTRLQNDIEKNEEDNRDVRRNEVQEERITANPFCCEDKLLSGYCGYSQKNINEACDNFEHTCYKHHYLKPRCCNNECM